MANLVIVGRRDEVDGMTAVEVEGDVVGELVDVDADVKFVIRGEINFVEELLFFR